MQRLLRRFLMTLAPLRPDWDLDDAREGVDDPDDYEFVEPDAVPTRVDPDVDQPYQIPVGPI